LTAVQIIANPAVTIARAFTNTFAGIAPGSITGFVLAQLGGAALGALLVAALYPAARPEAAAPLDVNTGQDAASATGEGARPLSAGRQ
jgi:glycerol uptake facilitator-like aquaporin